MTDLSWLDAIEARQRKHGGVTASDVARLVKALRDAHAKLARVEAEVDRRERWPRFAPYVPVFRAALAGEDS